MALKFNPLSGQFDLVNAVPAYVFDTKENIFTSTPEENKRYIATDTGYEYVYDGNSWWQSGVKFVDGAGWDAGVNQDSSPIGVHEDYISGKTFYDFVLSVFNNFGDSDTSVGAMQYNVDTDPDSLQVYTDLGVVDIPLDTAEITGNYVHVVNNTTISIRSGNSISVGLNGIPTVQEYSVDAGAYPYPISVDGGTF